MMPTMMRNPTLLQREPLLRGERATPAHRLDREEHEVPAVQHRDRQQVEDRQVDAEERHEPEELVEAGLGVPARTPRRS
jgi:hypothetical protein